MNYSIIFIEISFYPETSNFSKNIDSMSRLLDINIFKSVVKVGLQTMLACPVLIKFEIYTLLLS